MIHQRYQNSPTAVEAKTATSLFGARQGQMPWRTGWYNRTDPT